MIRAVLDTNVVVSALISPFGNEARALLEIRRGRITPCFSQPMLDEYAGVLARPKFAFPEAEIDALIRVLQSSGNLFAARPLKGTSPDPKDEPFIACAIASQAEFLVTGNKRHFPPGCCGATRIVSAGELIRELSTPQSP